MTRANGKARPLRGRPGTTALPLLGARAVGGPVALGAFIALAAVALVGWLAAAATLVAASPQIAARDPLAWQPVLAAHLVALGLLPAAVSGASFHLLPVMLRNDVRRPRLLFALPVLLAGGFLVAPGIAFDVPALMWTGVILVAGGFAVVLTELLGLVARAPRGRTLLASRTGVALACFHVAAAFVLGGAVFAHQDEPFAGVVHDRWLLVHIHLAVVGWLTLLIVTVGRTLGPMLALAPAAAPRRLPVTELVLCGGLWALIAGIAAGVWQAQLAGAAAIAAALAGFAFAMLRILGRRRVPLEGPLIHIISGVAFLAQAAVLGIAVIAGAVSPERALTAYVVLLLVGWAAGVTLGHLGKLLSLSLWVWWPPGPRPKQEALYPRRLWRVEAGAFVVGVEVLAVGSLTGSGLATRAGALSLLAAAVLAAVAASRTLSRRPGRGSYAPPL